VFFCVPNTDVPKLFLVGVLSETVLLEIELFTALRIPTAQCFSLIIFFRCFVWYVETGTSVVGAGGKRKPVCYSTVDAIGRISPRVQ
jgi:hypothetical protein